MLYVSPNGYLGGAEKFIVNITRQHQERGAWVPRIVFFGPGPAVQIARDNGVTVDVLPFAFRLSRPSLARAIRYLRRYVRTVLPAVVHLTMPYSHIVMFLPCVGLGVKTVWFQHGPVGGWLDQIGSLLPSDLILFNSRFLQREHNRMWGGPARHRQAVVSLGVPRPTVNRAEVAAIREELLGDDRTVLVGMAGRVSRFKGFETFVSAIARLRDRVPAAEFSGWRFVIVGGANMPDDKVYERELRQLAARLRLDKVLRFLGYVNLDRINEHYAALDAFVHASTQPESFGLVVAEVMVQETLVIGSCHGGIQEILRNDQTGYTFDAQAEDAAARLSRVLARVLPKLCPAQPGERPYARLIENARHLIETEFSMTTMTERIERTYTDLLNRGESQGRALA